MKKRLCGTVLAVFLLAGSALMGQSADFYPLSLVKPGLKGFGKTVFEGTQVQKFDVEILGVLRNYGPQQNMILARLSGQHLDETGVFAGMSGSPVYVEDKLLGAVAFAFNFSKVPIAGITPIEEMVDIFKERPKISSPPSSHSLLPAPTASSSLRKISDLIPRFELPRIDAGRSLGGLDGAASLQPIATPLNLSGFTEAAVIPFLPALKGLGLVPVRGGGAASPDEFPDAPLQAGSTLSVQLVRGDMEIAASGTITHISGNKVYAFGHPFLSIGSTSLPFSKGAVIAILPSLMSSQKFTASTRFVGSITQDRATGIMGMTGQQPTLIPVDVKLLTSRNELKNFHYEMIDDKLLTPLLLTLTVNNSIISSERSIGGQTLQVKGSIAIKGQPDVNFENSVSDLNNSSVFAALAAATPVNFLLNSGFDNVKMERIQLNIRAVEQTRELDLENVWQDKLVAKAGDEVRLTVFLRKSNGEIMTQKYPVKIPEDIAPGPLKVVIGDGVSLTKMDAAADMNDFVPENLAQLVRAINNIKKNDRLYIRLYRDESGAVIAGTGLPDLPPSMLALYNSEKTSGEAKPIKRVIYVEHELPPMNYVLSGEKTLQVKVES